jgi:hypothetical protein
MPIKLLGTQTPMPIIKAYPHVKKLSQICPLAKIYIEHDLGEVSIVGIFKFE